MKIIHRMFALALLLSFSFASFAQQPLPKRDWSKEHARPVVE